MSLLLTSISLHTVSQHLPFLVTRSKFGNLPVYINYKKGRTRIITRIRNIRGDVEVTALYIVYNTKAMNS